MSRLNLQAISGSGAPHSVTRAFRELDSRVYEIESLFSRYIKNAAIVASHADLQDLDFASAGHTGFASSAQLTAHTSSTSNPHTVTLQQAIAANATASSKPTFNGGVDLGTSGVLQSNVADGASAVGYDLNDATPRTQGTTFQIRDGSNYRMQVTWDGRFWFGYNPTAQPLAGHILSFTQSDNVSPVGFPHYAGILAGVTHIDTAQTVAKLYGLCGYASASATTGLTPTIIYGTAGHGVGSLNSTGFSSKYLAGVFGAVLGLAGAFGPADPDTSQGTDVPKGDWAHATQFWADYCFTSATKSLPTNRPAIISSLRAPIQGWSSTSGEQWAIYGDNPSPAGSITPAIGGCIRIPYAARGTRRTAAYYVPHAGAAGGPTGNVSGDIYFDIGTNNTIGLYTHNGTNHAFLISQENATGNAAAAAAGSAATLGNIDSGPAGTGQAGWIKAWVAINGAGTRKVQVWFPYWV